MCSTSTVSSSELIGVVRRATHWAFAVGSSDGGVQEHPCLVHLDVDDTELIARIRVDGSGENNKSVHTPGLDPGVCTEKDLCTPLSICAHPLSRAEVGRPP